MRIRSTRSRRLLLSLSLCCLSSGTEAFAQQSGPGVLPSPRPASAGGAFTSPALAPDGTAAAPAYSFSSDTDSGVYRIGADNVGFSAGGTLRLDYNTTRILSTLPLLFTDNTVDIGATSATRPRTGYWGTSLRVQSDSGLLSFGVSDDTTITRTAAGKVSLTGTTPMFQFGGTTGSFPALKQNGATLEVKLADDSAYDNMRVASLVLGTSLFTSSNVPIFTVQNPTIASGGCTSPVMTASAGTASFLVTIGTSCSGVKTFTLTLPAATTRWACDGQNNTSDAAQQTNYIVFRTTSTTAVVGTSYDRTTGVQEDFTASDTYLIKCLGG